MKIIFKSALVLFFFILTSEISLGQSWDRYVENLDKKGQRHGYFEVQDSLSYLYGYGIFISRTDLGVITDLTLDGPAMICQKIKTNDTIVGFELDNKYISFKDLGNEQAIELMKNNPKLIFVIRSASPNTEIKIELIKSNHFLRTREYDGLTIKGNYDHGKMHGKWQTFDYEGNLINTRIFENDKELKCEGDCSYPPFADFYY